MWVSLLTQSIASDSWKPMEYLSLDILMEFVLPSCCNRLLVIDLLHLNMTYLLNPTLHAICFGPQTSSDIKVHNLKAKWTCVNKVVVFEGNEYNTANFFRLLFFLPCYTVCAAFSCWSFTSLETLFLHPFCL